MYAGCRRKSGGYQEISLPRLITIAIPFSIYYVYTRVRHNGTPSFLFYLGSVDARCTCSPLHTFLPLVSPLVCCWGTSATLRMFRLSSCVFIIACCYCFSLPVVIVSHYLLLFPHNRHLCYVPQCETYIPQW